MYKKHVFTDVFFLIITKLAVPKTNTLSNIKQLVIIDNYDSFTFNLVHYFEGLGCAVTVFRNDKFDIEDLQEYDAIVLSPGPGLPKDAGLSMLVIERYAYSKKILGICLGHQAIGEYFGATLENLSAVVHGQASVLKIVEPSNLLFQNLAFPLEVGRYHSWAISNKSFPTCLQITATDERGCIMAISHITLPIHGLQFHPESILTPQGKAILANWLVT
ncbi:MAG: aminodeoxychorismate/anthranilate synthase component II [Flavobacterium sp.]|nr:aminodeoxychorismate/anthranilate synthase component II [Flavobacterium sp.]